MKKFLKIGVLVGLSVVVALMGCHHEKGTDNHSYDVKEQVTMYGDYVELFVEMGPFIVGEKCEVVVHLTNLDNYKPLDSNRVVMRLNVSGEEQQWELDKAIKSGVYKFEIIPEVTGLGMVSFEVFVNEGCDRFESDHVHFFATYDEWHNNVHSHDDEIDALAMANAIVFSKEQSWKVDFATEIVVPQRFGRVIETSAQILPSQGDVREVSAKASGIVVFNNPNLVEGAKVNVGQKLFSIESSGMADNNMGVKFREASATYSLAKEEYERKLGLVADKIVTESELQRAKMELETAQAVYDNLKNNFSVHGEFVSAPLSGYVQEITVRNGTYVDAGQLIMIVSQNRELFVRADVQPRYYQDLKHIVGANIGLMNSDEVYDIKDLEGGLVSYGRAVDTDNPLIPVTFKFRNSIDVLSGGFVTLYIRTESEEEVVTIPNTGIVEVMGSYFVFVQLTPELFEKRAVELGATDGVRTVVKSGLNEGERVVCKGASMVKMAQTSATLDPHAGHFH